MHILALRAGERSFAAISTSDRSARQSLRSLWLRQSRLSETVQQTVLWHVSAAFFCTDYTVPALLHEAVSNALKGPTLLLEPMRPQNAKGDPKAALCRSTLVTYLEGTLEVEAQTRGGRVTDAVTPDINSQVAQTIA